MDKYLIYTTNDTEPLVIETNRDLQVDYISAMNQNLPVMYFKYKQDMHELGVYMCEVVLNTHQIVAITTSKKKE